MTYEEAINILQAEINHIKNMIYPQDMETTIWVSNRIEAINMAIEAIKKQIPKKPDAQQVTGIDCWGCPTCGSFLGFEVDCRDEEYQDNYCCCCGQAISWEEEQNEQYLAQRIC